MFCGFVSAPVIRCLVSASTDRAESMGAKSAIGVNFEKVDANCGYAFMLSARSVAADTEQRITGTSLLDRTRIIFGAYLFTLSARFLFILFHNASTCVCVLRDAQR